MSPEELKELKAKAKEIRELTIDEIGYLGVGHIGGALSIIEVLTLLYYKHMRIDPKNPKKRNRDQLVLSKGHAGPALYSILADKGYFPKEWLHTLNKGGTKLPSHCDMNLTPGIDMTTGALGQGISAAIGKALANRMDGVDSFIYVIIGDGESNEGQIWESAMAAGHFKLANIIAFTDYNKLQLDGYTYDIMDLEDITSKWLSFGWHVQRINGHDLNTIDAAIRKAKEEKCRPSMIVLDTIKGKGAYFAEGIITNHNMVFDYETAQKAIKLLEGEE
ncbi:MAG: transketolase [Spirochaetes bacterium]|nr:MAG: transketolase [Spirochaetota bacterium]